MTADVNWMPAGFGGGRFAAQAGAVASPSAAAPAASSFGGLLDAVAKSAAVPPSGGSAQATVQVTPPTVTADPPRAGNLARLAVAARSGAAPTTPPASGTMTRTTPPKTPRHKTNRTRAQRRWRASRSPCWRRRPRPWRRRHPPRRRPRHRRPGRRPPPRSKRHLRAAPYRPPMPPPRAGSVLRRADGGEDGRARHQSSARPCLGAGRSLHARRPTAAAGRDGAGGARREPCPRGAVRLGRLG